MASRTELISSRKKELLGKGYPRDIVNKSMDWALGCAEGMANYVSKSAPDDNPGTSLDKLTNQFLPQYLTDAETWIRGFGHEPKPSK